MAAEDPMICVTVIAPLLLARLLIAPLLAASPSSNDADHDLLNGSIQVLGSPSVPPDPRVLFLDLDTAVMVGRPVTIGARVDDPGGRVLGVRFTINGDVKSSRVRDPSRPRDTFSCTFTPEKPGRLVILVEGLDAGGRVLARDILWLKPSSPFTARITVRAPPTWGDLIPKDSPLHQHPIVSVHSLTPSSVRTEDDRFGPNRRPVRVVFIVDGEGFGPRLPALLEILESTGNPTRKIVRARDEVGLLVASGTMEVRRDFRDGSLERLIETVQGPAVSMAAEGKTDLGTLLRSMLLSSPEDASTVGIIVTNGLRWGTLWRRKPIPDTDETNALLTPEDMKQIRALSYEKDIPIFTLAVSTPERPLEIDDKGRMRFDALERKLRQSFLSGTSPAEQGEESPAHASIFDVYIRQMFDLLRTVSAATGAGSGIRLCTSDPDAARASVGDILGSIIGRFQRHDFEIFESPPAGRCDGTGQKQELQSAEPRVQDRLVLGIALDRSGSTNLARAVYQVQSALRGIFGSLRLQDCLLLYSFSAGDAARLGDCVDSPEKIELASHQLKSGPSVGTDIFGAAFDIGHDMANLQAYVVNRSHAPEPGQKLNMAVVIITDGWQTVDTVDVSEAVSYLRTHGIRVFEVLIQGDPGGRNVAGWSSETGGARLPPGGMPIPVGKADDDIARLISSVYWGMRDIYELDYTSVNPENEWRDVCVRIKGRPDLFALREGGIGYRAGKSAYAYLFRTIGEAGTPIGTRRSALEILGEVGTEFEVRRVAAVAAGEEPALRVPAFMALLRMLTRLKLPLDRLERVQDAMSLTTRFEITKLLAASEGLDDGAVESVVATELRRPAAESSEELRWQALLALGRIDARLSDRTLQLLAALSSAPDQAPGVRDAATKLLQALSTRSAPAALPAANP